MGARRGNLKIECICRLLYPAIIISFSFMFIQTLKGQLSWQVTLPFAVNLVANLIFTRIQFVFRRPRLAAALILIVWSSISWSMAAVGKHHQLIALAQLPHVVWVSTATDLQLLITLWN